MMRASPSHRRLVTVFLLSILLHAAGIWLADQLIFQKEVRPYFAVRLLSPDKPEQQRFERRKKVAIPRQRDFLSRPMLEVPPRDLEVVESGPESLPSKRDLVIVTRLQPSLAESVRVSTKALPSDTEWEQEAWQGWRDSLFQASRTVEKGQGALTPFDIETRGRKSVVIVDPETGRLEKAYWFVPVYDYFGLMGGYNQHLKTFRERLKDIPQGIGLPRSQPDSLSQSLGITWEPIPVIGVVDSRFVLNCGPADQSAQKVKPDAIHRFGIVPSSGPVTVGIVPSSGPVTDCDLSWRDVLSYEEMRNYLVLLLEFIDVESTQSLARYLIEGGFAVVNGRQLSLLQEELARQLEPFVPQERIKEQVRAYLESRGVGEEHPSFPEHYPDYCAREVRKWIEIHLKKIDIWSDHPLMATYYQIRDYYPAPRRPAEPPLQGLELDGRLTAAIPARSSAYRGPLNCSSIPWSTD